MRIKSSPSNGPHLENFSVKLKETSREKLKENIYGCLRFSADNLIMRTGQEIAGLHENISKKISHDTLK